MNTPVSPELDRLLLEKDIPMPVNPTIADVVMWLYNKHGIWINVYQYKDHAADVNDGFVFRSNCTGTKEFTSPTEAYEAAITYSSNNI